MKEPKDLENKEVMSRIKMEKWLIEGGYDGLHCPDRGCRCKIGDLATCWTDKKHRKVSCVLYCHPGYLHETKKGWKITTNPLKAPKEIS